MFARSADELAGLHGFEKKPGGPGTSGSWRGVRGGAPNVNPTRAARGRIKKRAMFARSADELARLQGLEKKPGGSGTSGSWQGWGNHGKRRARAAQHFCARLGDKAKAYWRYVEPKATTHCAKRQAARAWRLPRFPQGGAPNVTLPRAACVA